MMTYLMKMVSRNAERTLRMMKMYIQMEEWHLTAKD